ncbi:ABC transporter permease [Coralloluteibacterium stylophorae]|uniref:ABC transporter permease n=1 Tax=Coralloluteibacterium stylophorae TaxID=1776034 RepID=A0A8J7VQS3_9GAMM|nr:ABC transporter permease [Coralloluteibacterium stylophorae]MBS7458233.1 ABC transporter permease [Coralloluteibacterium stylophorae]
MALFKQISEITAMNLRNVPQRWGTSMVIVVGIAGVVGVLVSILAMGEGFRATLAGGAAADRAIVLREGASTELTSGLTREQADLIAAGAGVAAGADGRPLASPELNVIADLPRDGTTANAAMRGVTAAAFAVRPEVRIVEGRMFEAGPRELIVGRGAAAQFDDLGVGTEIRLRDSTWTVVGMFEAGGGAHESELWGDADTLQSAFRRGGYNSVTVQLESPEAIDAFREALAADPRLTLKIQSLADFYREQSKGLSMLINGVGYFVAVIMAVGAVFGALNTMYAAIGTRQREIATLRAIGFGGLPVVVSVMAEALLLALLGGVAGGALAWAIFNGYSVSTLGAGFSQVAFDFRVTPALLVNGLVWALLIGIVGGLVPALRAARLPVTTALRTA